MKVTIGQTVDIFDLAKYCKISGPTPRALKVLLHA